jgi:hypothetical protein
LRLAKVRRRIEVRWDEHKDPVNSLKRRRERSHVVDIRFDEITTPLRPGFPFADVANHAADGLARG